MQPQIVKAAMVSLGRLTAHERKPLQGTRRGQGHSHWLLAPPSTATWAQDLSIEWHQRPVSWLLALLLSLIVLVMLTYGIRQSGYALHRMFGRLRYPYDGLEQADWPKVTVFIAAHNEEAVIADSMQALLKTDYPPDRIKVVVVNDRSSDQTARIVDEQIHLHPNRIEAFHRVSGKPGKAAALKDAMRHANGDIAIIFDADYTPGPALVRQLVAPFLDPEVGAVMGRVVPRNVGTNLLTRMLDMERSAGYQVDQQARMNLQAVPQFGGTVGGVRLSAIESVGGWHDDVLAEDTDITFRLLIGGWKTVYNNQAACYEEVPEEWAVRLRQVHRWAKGHNQVLLRHAKSLLLSTQVSMRERLDGLLLLHIFLMQPLLILGWMLAMALYYMNAAETLTLFIPGLVLLVYSALGGFSVFLQMAYAVLIDGHRARIRILPFQMFNFLASLPTITSALGSSVLERFVRKELVWNKTVRYRKQVTA
jgi:cellulose synthase/poly-beta-1,6-N-acetylglucosamine synthase-like glycosyltransferase